MSFFSTIFGENSSPSKQDFWKEITSEEDLDKAIEESKNSLVVIFKHSTRCIISKTVLKNLEIEVIKNNNYNIKFYLLDLLNWRNLSNLIAEKLQVTHQSPQILVLKNGVVVHHASHENIDLQNVLKLI